METWDGKTRGVTGTTLLGALSTVAEYSRTLSYKRRGIISIDLESKHRNMRELDEVVYLSLGLDRSRHVKLIAH